MFYFAYGSNTQEQLEKRLGHLVDHLGPAVLPGYRLVYMGRSPRWCSATATVLPLSPDEHGRVYGTLYGGLSDLDYHELDSFEDVKLDNVVGRHVGRYRPVEEQVLVDGEYHFARFYVMTGHLSVDREVRPPSRAYLLNVIEAALVNGVPREYIIETIMTPVCWDVEAISIESMYF